MRSHTSPSTQTRDHGQLRQSSVSPAPDGPGPLAPPTAEWRMAVAPGRSTTRCPLLGPHRRPSILSTLISSRPPPRQSSVLRNEKRRSARNIGPASVRLSRRIREAYEWRDQCVDLRSWSGSPSPRSRWVECRRGRCRTRSPPLHLLGLVHGRRLLRDRPDGGHLRLRSGHGVPLPEPACRLPERDRGQQRLHQFAERSNGHHPLRRPILGHDHLR